MEPGVELSNNLILYPSMSHYKPVVRHAMTGIGVCLTLMTSLEPVCLCRAYDLGLPASRRLPTNSQLDGTTTKSKVGGQTTRVKNPCG